MAKSDNYINAANSIVCVVGTAAAETVTGGAGTAISGVASLNELRKRIFAKTPEINAAIAADIKAALEKPVKPLPAEADIHIPQMIAKARLQPSEIMALQRRPADICTAMLRQMTDREHLDREIQAAFREVVAPILEARLNDPQTNDTLRPAFETAVAETMGYIAEKVDLLASEMSEHAQARGIAEGYLIGLARQIAPAVEDVDTAQRELQNAIAVAGNMKERAALSSNVDDGVQQTMQEVEALNEAQQMQQASDRLNKALAASANEQERKAAVHLRLLDAAIDQAILTRSVEGAVRHTLDKLEREVPELGERFEALRVVQNEWYERGRDKGLRFDLEVSVELAEASRSIANGPDQVGAALNDLGIALQTLGARESGTARLEQAVAIYQAALLEYTRERVPPLWASMQNNLGNSLQALGERESGTVRLEQAVVAFESALLEYSRERFPLDWAGLQNNLGTALKTLGERERGTARLEQAVAAHAAGLDVVTRENSPMVWASMQNNLGNALSNLGVRESGIERLEQAVAAYEAALLEWTQERVPLKWAAAQNNLGNVLHTLGTRESGTARLEQAVAAYEAALLERTQERVPLDWAMTQHNLGGTLEKLGERESGTARLHQAIAAFEAASLVRTKDRMPLQWALTRGNVATVLCVLSEKAEDLVMLDEAIAIMLEVGVFLREKGHDAGADMFSYNIVLAQKRRAAMVGEDGI